MACRSHRVRRTQLDAATFQVTYQLKILTTAIFSMFMLGKTFTSQQWGALAMLFVGVAMVQMPKSDSGKHKGHEVPGPNDKTQEDYIIGITAVLMACCSSAFAGVYFERILKKQAGSLWLRNIQLGIFGFLLGVVGAFSKVRGNAPPLDWTAIQRVSQGFGCAQDGTELSERGFLHHFRCVHRPRGHVAARRELAVLAHRRACARVCVPGD